MPVVDKSIAEEAAINPDKLDRTKGSTFLFEDDFVEWVDGDKWTEVSDAGATGAVGVIDGLGGIMKAFCDGDDNDECYLVSKTECFICNTTDKIRFRARVKCAEAATNEASLVVGLAQEAAADLMVDDGGGVATTLDGILFYKASGGLVWECESSNATSQTESTASVAFASDTWFNLYFEFDPKDGVTGKIYFKIDDTWVAEHEITISGLAEMHVVFGVKAGSAAEESIQVDYVRVEQDIADRT